MGKSLGQQGLWSKQQLSGGWSANLHGWQGVILSGDRWLRPGQWLLFQFSQGLLTRSCTFQIPRTALQASVSNEQHTQGKSNNNNEVNYCLARGNTSAPPYITCTKAEKNKKKKSMSDNAKKMCYLESSYKIKFFHFDFNYKLKAIVTQKCTFSYVFSNSNIIRQMSTIIPNWIFFLSSSEEWIGYSLNPWFKTKPMRHNIIGLTKRAWLWI